MPKLRIVNFNQVTDTYQEKIAFSRKISGAFSSTESIRRRFKLAFLSLNKIQCPFSRFLSIEIKLSTCIAVLTVHLPTEI